MWISFPGHSDKGGYGCRTNKGKGLQDVDETAVIDLLIYYNKCTR